MVGTSLRALKSILKRWEAAKNGGKEFAAMESDERVIGSDLKRREAEKNGGKRFAAMESTSDLSGSRNRPSERDEGEKFEILRNPRLRRVCN